MSIKLISKVWDTNIGPATKRLVLLALADAANDDGVCWPSVSVLAQKAGASRRRTEEVLAELSRDGIVTKERRYNSSNVYQIQHEKLVPGESESTPREICGTREEVGDPPRDLRVQTREEVGTNRKRTVNEPSLGGAAAPSDDFLSLFEASPPVPVAKPKRAKKAGHVMPEDWKPSESARTTARETRLDLDFESAQFRDYHAARGSKMVDWDRAFQTWLRNSIKWTRERNVQRGVTVDAGVDLTELNQWGKPVYYPSGKKIIYNRYGMEQQV